MGSRLLVSYRFECRPAEAAARALGIALEQSSELPAGAEPDSVHELGLPGRVEEIVQESVADSDERARFRCTISFPAELVSTSNPAALLNVLFGNTSMQPDVTLAGAEIPPPILASYTGPAHGIEGLRARLGKATGPITCTALKPVGLSSEELGILAARFARAGVHLIKDDHGFVDQRYAPFASRIRACHLAVTAAAAETGTRSLYAPHLCGSLDSLRSALDLCARAGVEAVMMAPMLVGLPAFAVAANEAAAAGMMVLAHPAYSGGTRVAPEFLLGVLFRLLGADAVIFVNHGGRFGTPPESCRQLAEHLRQPWMAFRPSLPVPAGGMNVSRVPEMIEFYGQDVGLLVSGALYPADDGLEVRARALVDAAASTRTEGMAD